MHDRAYIFVNKEPRGILSRAENINSMPLSVNVGDTLHILVENQGRIGYGAHTKDFKGIVSNVTLGDTSGDAAVNLQCWTVYSMALNDTKALVKYVTTVLDLQQHNADIPKLLKNDFEVTRGKGSFWYGEFRVPCPKSHHQEVSILDTFLKFPKGWSKGIAFINDRNIGKYWPRIGPQMTLYVPGVWLKCQQTNSIILFEQDHPGCSHLNNKCFVELVNEPIIDGPTPYAFTNNIKKFH